MTENKSAAELINLVGATDSRLNEIKLKYNLSASVSFLRKVGICLLSERIEATEEILAFFDAVYSSAISRFENTDVSVLSPCEGEIARTFHDLTVKYRYLTDNDADVLPFDSFLHVSSEYLSTLDVCAPSTVSVANENADLTFTDSSKNKIISLSIYSEKAPPYGYERKSKAAKSSHTLAQTGDVFLLLTSKGDAADFNAKINELFEDPDFANAVKTNTTVGCGGILYALSQICVGATVHVGAVDTAESLSALVNLHEGKTLISASAENEDFISSVANKYSVFPVKVAEASDSLSFVLDSTDSKLNIRSNFLRSLFMYRTSVSEMIPTDSFRPSNPQKLYVTKDGQTEEFAKTVLHKGHLISALKAKEVSFTSAINVALDTVFALLCAGVPRKSIGLTFKIGCNKKCKEDALSALLGIYRVCVELSVPEKDSVVVEANDNYIFCCAYAREEKTNVPSLSREEPSLLHLFSFGRFNNTIPALMPDFPSVRKMCTFLEDSFANGIVLRAEAINGPVLPVAKDFCEEPLSLFPYTNDGINESTRAQGVIVQIPINEKINVPLVGVIRKG